MSNNNSRKKRRECNYLEVKFFMSLKLFKIEIPESAESEFQRDGQSFLGPCSAFV